ncbi:hypothetical protein EV424DRAFT_1476371 [Suillus variegatus]|nr:hypothetical protein EV424DRAFT_1476371 [Suillus variegatus]
MLQELSHMDRITQLQEEIQRLLTIMSSTITYLTARSTFLQIRNPDKYDAPELFEANMHELVQDLIHWNNKTQDANEEYIQAVDRAKNLHRKISEFLRTMLDNADGPVESIR